LIYSRVHFPQLQLKLKVLLRSSSSKLIGD